MTNSTQFCSSKLGVALVALILASTLASNAAAQCVSGNSSTHSYGALNSDFLTIPNIGAGPQFQKPVKVVAGPDGVYVLDGGIPKLVKISVTIDPESGAQLATPEWTDTLVAPAVDMLSTGMTGSRILYATGREAGIVLVSSKPTIGGPAVSTWSVDVTDQTPVAIVNAGGYDWVTDGSNILHRVTLPTYAADSATTATGASTPPTLQGTASVVNIPFNYPNASLGAMAYDGLNLWVIFNGTNLAKVDPSTGQMVSYLPNIGHPDTLAFDGTFLWTGDNSGVRKIDPVAGQLVLDHPASLPGPVTGLYIDGSWMWAANGTGTLARARTCDAASLGGITLPANAQTVTAAAGALWITYSNSPVVSVR